MTPDSGEILLRFLMLGTLDKNRSYLLWPFLNPHSWVLCRLPSLFNEMIHMGETGQTYLWKFCVAALAWFYGPDQLTAHLQISASGTLSSIQLVLTCHLYPCSQHLLTESLTHFKLGSSVNTWAGSALVSMSWCMWPSDIIPQKYDCIILLLDRSA